MGGDHVLERAIAGLREADSLGTVQQIVRTAARELVDANGATFVLLEDGYCFYADEDAISPLWKGQRFPVDQCISGWSMTHGRPAVVADIRLDERIPQAAYAPTFVRSLAMVPIGTATPVGAIGTYWSRPRRATDDEVALLAALADATAAALDRLLPVG